MKKIFTLISLLIIAIATDAQLLVDDFNYSGALSANGWSPHSGTGTLPIQTTTGLTYAGYAGSGVGNAANIINNGEDVNKDFAEQSADGSTIYMSALVNVTEVANSITGGYFWHLGDRTSATSFTSFAARVFARVDASGNVNFGLSNNGGDAAGVYSATNFAKNTTYLLIVKYTINTAGDETAKLWVKSSGVPASEAAAGTADVEVTQPGTTANIIDAVGLRQAATNPDLVFDGLRISTGWFNAPLPINLLSFSALLNNSNVNVAWSTTNEIQSSSFAIEKSINGRDFKAIGTVQAKGDIATNNYSFVDEKVVAGVSYYRLRMIDKDGSFKYSAIESVKTKSIGLSVYPNPVKNTITVQHEVAAKGATVSVMTVSGKAVFQANVEAGATQTSIDAAKLAPGSYLVVLINNGVKLTKQFIKE